MTPGPTVAVLDPAFPFSIAAVVACTDRDHAAAVGLAAGGEQPRVADPGGGRGQAVQVRAGGGEQHRGLGDVQGRAALHPRQCSTYLLRGGRTHRIRLAVRRAAGRAQSR